MHIITPRLVLRDFGFADVDAVLAYQSTEEYLRFYPWEGRSRLGVETLVERFIGWQHERPRTRFQVAITLRSNDALIGCCGVRTTSSDNSEGEFGCELNPDHWGQGYAVEASRGIIDFGFNTVGLHRIYAECVAENEASIKLCKSLGMRQEGLFKNRAWMKQRWWDISIWA
ncbi:MAG: GNAT family N-acetyltransferase, partial [Candidatus Hydrogenedentes bacterium]|nr:GNAT family N-acetyltransferase [Candidatus Hydrogenedentota bacterium]